MYKINYMVKKIEKWWEDKEKTDRKNILKYFGIGLIVFFILSVTVTYNMATAKSEKVAAEKVAAAKIEAEKATAEKIAANKLAEEKAAADKVAAEKVDPNEIAKNVFKDRIIKVIPFEESSIKYIAVMHESDVMFNEVSVITYNGANYKEIWKTDIFLDNDITEKLFVVKDIDNNGKNEVYYAALSYGSHMGSGTVGAYFVSNNQEYTIEVGDGVNEPNSSNLNLNPNIISYLKNSANEIKNELNKAYNIKNSTSSGNANNQQKSNPIKVSIDELSKSDTEYFSKYVQISGRIGYIKEDYGIGDILIESKNGNIVHVHYSGKTKNVKGSFVEVKAQVMGVTSNYTSNGIAITIPTLDAYEVSNSIN